jgi:hypothetical protein
LVAVFVVGLTIYGMSSSSPTTTSAPVSPVLLAFDQGDRRSRYGFTQFSAAPLLPQTPD